MKTNERLGMLRLSVYADKHHQSFAPINFIHHVKIRFFLGRSGCGRTLLEPNGLVSSPELVNSVTPPAEGEHCEWRITATHGERIVLNVTELDIYESDNCETDYIEVRDGYWHKSPLLGE
ncbi:hypothetical protein ISCGN_015884 [Ixodes scapularis]